MSREIILTQGRVAIVDDADFEWLNQWKWNAHDSHGWAWYARRIHMAGEGKKTQIIMHRLILKAPKGAYSDHINGNGLDNRRANLRLCNSSQNNSNRHYGWGSSKFKGVSWDKINKKWAASIKHNKQQIALGRFSLEIDAAKAYDMAAPLYHGEFARTNKMIGLL